MPDVVVIGAGPNGLVAANVLADHGLQVVVFEAQDEPGGAVRSGEITLSGYTHDRFSAFYPLAAASPAIRGLELEDHGLVWCANVNAYLTTAEFALRSSGGALRRSRWLLVQSMPGAAT